MSKKILITGGSGLVGKQLSEMLVGAGYEVRHLSRHKNKLAKYPTYSWDIRRGEMDEDALQDISSIIHLAGAGVADKRWTDSRKAELTYSRVDSAQLLYDKVKSLKIPLEAFISASAVGIYGFDTGGIEQTEERTYLGDDFLATLTKKWEDAADKFQELDARVVKLRIGLVLSLQGGLMQKLLPVAKLGLSSAFGNGHQYMSWIDIEDLCQMFVRSLEDSTFDGAYNAVAPNPVTNKEFLNILAAEINKPYFLPNVPKFAFLGFFLRLITAEIYLNYLQYQALKM